MDFDFGQPTFFWSVFYLLYYQSVSVIAFRVFHRLISAARGMGDIENAHVRSIYHRTIADLDGGFRMVGS